MFCLLSHKRSLQQVKADKDRTAKAEFWQVTRWTHGSPSPIVSRGARHSTCDFALGSTVNVSILSFSPWPSGNVRWPGAGPHPSLWMILCVSVCTFAVSTSALLVGSGAIVAGVVVIVILLLTVVLLLLKRYKRYEMSLALELSGPFSDARMNGN